MMLCQSGCGSAHHSPVSLNAPVTSQNLLQGKGHALRAQSLTSKTLRMTPFLFQQDKAQVCWVSARGVGRPYKVASRNQVYF